MPEIFRETHAAMLAATYKFQTRRPSGTCAKLVNEARPDCVAVTTKLVEQKKTKKQKKQLSHESI